MFRIRLKELREKAGYSQYSFAESFGVSQSAVGNWEAGKREPNFETTQRLADFFGVTVDYLLGRDTEKAPANRVVSMNPIRKIRTEAGLSQVKFADMLNVHQTAVSQWEQGRTTPDVETAKKISELFNVSLDTVLDNPHTKKAPVPEDKRHVSDDDIMFALWGDASEIDKDDLEDVKRYAAFVRERKQKK